MVRPIDTHTKGNLRVVICREYNLKSVSKTWKEKGSKLVTGYPCTKLVVPSSGSTIHVGSSVSSVAP